MNTQKREILFKYLKDFILFPYFTPILHYISKIETHTNTLSLLLHFLAFPSIKPDVCSVHGGVIDKSQAIVIQLGRVLLLIIDKKSEDDTMIKLFLFILLSFIMDFNWEHFRCLVKTGLRTKFL